MIFAYYRTPPAAPGGIGCPYHSGTFLDFLALCADRGVDILAPVSARASAAPRKRSASYILQKDPDGSWFIDQVKPDAAAQIRPAAASAAAAGGYRAPAGDSGDAFFIIEID
jgi:hypothetical protein